MANIIWEPWKTYNNCPDNKLPISEPPCPHCRYWYPIKNKDGFGGVTLCQARYMLPDFSCFINADM